MKNQHHVQPKDFLSNVVPIIDIKVGEVKSKRSMINGDERNLSLFPKKETANGKREVSINEACNELNQTSEWIDKQSSSFLLKGLYEGGFKGEHQVEGSDYLFFDIDVNGWR